jgi:membrane-bound lytic murein transglycosylase A
MIDGPIGSLGVPLLPQRTIAVDVRAVPLGAPVFIATTYPSTSRPLARLVLAQDTGGAIRGAVRADFFWGFGSEAGQEAGRMRQDGRVFLLWPKGAPLPGCCQAKM